MSENPNTTPRTEAYREEVSLLVDRLRSTIRRLTEVEERHAIVPVHVPVVERAVNHFKLNQALTYLEDVETDLIREMQEGVAP